MSDDMPENARVHRYACLQEGGNTFGEVDAVFLIYMKAMAPGSISPAVSPSSILQGRS